MTASNLVLEIIPPIGPGFLNTTFLFNDSVLNDRTQNTESHSHAMIVIAVYADAPLEFRYGFADDLKTVIQLDTLHTELGCISH